MEKIFQIFQDLRFDISFADALLLMPRFAPTIKSLLMNKEKLLELAKIPLNENCSTMLLKKLPGKLGDPDKFLIPCNLPGMDVCHALADLGASINLMPTFYLWKKLSLPELYTTQMTLELADDQLLVPSKGSTEDFVKVGNFHFPTDFVVVDFEADPRVPLILRRSFLRTSHVINEKEKQEVKNLAELMAKRQTRITPCLNNFKVICKESIFHSNKPPQVSLVFTITSTLPSIEPKDSLIMGDDNLSIFSTKEIVPILRKSKETSRNDTIEVPTYNEGYYDSEGDVTYLESLLSNDTTHNLSPEVFFDHEPQQLKNEPENEPLITFSPKSDPLHHEFTVTEKFSYIIESLPNLYFSENSDPNREEINIFSEPDDSIPPGIESDFDSEEDIIDNLLNENPTHERLTFNIEPDAPVINNVDELNEDECFDPGGGENNVEVDDSFIFVTWNFLPFLTYPEVSPLLSSTKNEDTIYDPGIST
ncbi:reverse transcriptase domain-containing protein [Tanacetum coccineum]